MKCILQYFLWTRRHILQKSQGIYKLSEKPGSEKKMAQVASNSVILAQKKIKSKTKQNQTTEKQTNKLRQG